MGNSQKGKPSKFLNYLKWILFSVVGLYSILLIPSSDPEIPAYGIKQPFVWNQDSLWFSLEKQYRALQNINARRMACVFLLVFNVVVFMSHQLFFHLFSYFCIPHHPLQMYR